MFYKKRIEYLEATARRLGERIAELEHSFFVHVPGPEYKISDVTCGSFEKVPMTTAINCILDHLDLDLVPEKAEKRPATVKNRTSGKDPF